jgi:hypothetical protein
VAIFVNYRREDSQSITGRIDDHLRITFGDADVYRDIDSIPPGVDFVEHLRTALGDCDVCIAILGTRWISDRLADENDFVRLELEAALTNRIPIIPVLVEGARLPKREQVPASLHSLLRRQAITVDSGSDFRVHVLRLVEAIKQIRQAQATEEARRQAEAKAESRRRAEAEAEVRRREQTEVDARRRAEAETEARRGAEARDLRGAGATVGAWIRRSPSRAAVVVGTLLGVGVLGVAIMLTSPTGPAITKTIGTTATPEASITSGMSEPDAPATAGPRGTESAVPPAPAPPTPSGPPAPGPSPAEVQRQRWLSGKVVFTELHDNDAPRPIRIAALGSVHEFSSPRGWRCKLIFGDTGDPREISCTGEYDPPPRARLSCMDAEGGRACGAWYRTPRYDAIGSPRSYLVMQLLD